MTRRPGGYAANSLEARVSPSLAVTFNASCSNAAPSSIAKTGGDTQSDTVATTLVIPLEVIVRDANSNPVTGAAVTWTATNGSVTGTTTTGADGKTTNVLTLGTAAGAASVTANRGFTHPLPRISPWPQGLVDTGQDS